MEGEIVLIRSYLRDLIKFTCRRARQHNHDAHHSIGIRKWTYNFLHDESVIYIREMVWILNQTKDK